MTDAALSRPHAGNKLRAIGDGPAHVKCRRAPGNPLAQELCVL